MRILVYEHVSGGGCSGKPISASVLSEGFAMLRSVASDFKSAGHEVTVLLDARLAKPNPPLAADCIIPIFCPQEAKKTFISTAKVNDAVYVTAPETGKVLQALVALVEHIGKISLNCDASTIADVSDKAVLSETLKRNCLPTPNTALLNIDSDLADVMQVIRKKFRYPAVFKPVDGVSCGGLSLIKEDAQIVDAINKVKSESAARQFIVQEFIEGEAASVSILCVNGKALAVSLNWQNVKIAEPETVSSYEGGAVPFNHSLRQEAFKVAEKVVECFSGLRGYVGVDLILSKGELFVVDVNPRLTTSYVGLSKVATFNVADAIVNSVLDDKIPNKRETMGFAYFSKVKTPKPTVNDFEKSAQIKEVLSPPFLLDEEDESCSLLVGQGESFEKARLSFEEAKKRLLDVIGRGK